MIDGQKTTGYPAREREDGGKSKCWVTSVEKAETGEELHRHSYGRVRGQSTASKDKTAEPRDEDGEDDDRKKVDKSAQIISSPTSTKVDQIQRSGGGCCWLHLACQRFVTPQNREQKEAEKMLDMQVGDRKKR